MSNKITLVKSDGNRFIPAYNSDWELSRKIAKGSIITVSFVKERNPLFHKKFFALMNLVFENQEHYKTLDELRYDLTVEAGFYTESTNLFTGEVKRNAKSIAFGNMDEIEFSELYNRMLDTIVRVFQWEKTDIEENISEFM